MKKTSLMYMSLLAVNIFIAILLAACSEDDKQESAPLPIPQNITATVQGNAIQVKWDAVPDASSYNVSWSTTGSNFQTVESQLQATSCIKNNPPKGSNYFRVQAVSYDGSRVSSWGSGYCNYSENEQPVTLSSPTGVNAYKSGTSIVVSWNAVSGATGYSVSRSSSATGVYSSLASVTKTNMTDATPLNGDNYYKVIATNGTATSEASNYAYLKYSGGGSGTETQKPNAPTNITATNVGSVLIPEVRISWDAVSNATSYKLFRSSSASGTYSQIGTTTSNVYQSDFNPIEGDNYYKVKAINSAGESAYSSSYAKYKHAPGASAAPCPVQNISVTGTSTISISWSPSTGTGCGTPTSYEVHKHDPNTGNYNLLTTTSSKNYSDRTSHPGINRYAIKAINNNGSSVNYAISSEVPLSIPTGFSAKKSGTNIVFSWSKVAAATGYQIFSSSSVNGTYTIEAQIDENTTSHTKYYPASAGTTRFFKIKAIWKTSYGSPTIVTSNLSSYKSISF